MSESEQARAARQFLRESRRLYDLAAAVRRLDVDVTHSSPLLRKSVDLWLKTVLKAGEQPVPDSPQARLTAVQTLDSSPSKWLAPTDWEALDRLVATVDSFEPVVSTEDRQAYDRIATQLSPVLDQWARRLDPVPRFRRASRTLLSILAAIAVVTMLWTADQLWRGRPGPWVTNPHTDTQYRLTPPISLAEVKVLAEVWGGQVVTVDDAEEERWLVNTIASADGCWVGLVKANGGNGWRWLSGEESSYRNWDSGEPNNAPPGEECVVMGASGWYDAPCSEQHRGIIELPAD